jgi:hypothetical protein
MGRMSGTGRFVVCRVGEGYSVEDARTGERVSWHKTYDAAWKQMKAERHRAEKEAHDEPR